MSSEDLYSGPSPASIPWVRKRDGSVVAFDPAKLASSIYAARVELDTDNAAFHAQELSQAVLHFLSVEFEGQIPTTEAVSETVVTVLREIGQAPTARVYHDYRQKRQQGRQRLQVLGVRQPSPPVDRAVAPPGETANAVESWDKARIVSSLQNEADLDPATSREIAASVEKKLLLCELSRVPTGLIRELVDSELLERGFAHALHRRRLLGVESRAIDALFARRPSPEQVHRWAGRELMRQYALQEVYSRDIAGLHEEGLLHLFDAPFPSHWAAVSLDVFSLAARSAGCEAFLSDLESELGRLCKRVQGTIAIEALDSVLALVVDRAADPADFAERVAAILRRIVRSHEAFLVVNLNGRIPASVATTMSDGPLFQLEPNELQDRFANRFSLQLAERIVSDTTLAAGCRIDFHPDIQQDEDDFRLDLAAWSRLARKSGNLSFCFDRESTSLAEGLTWTPNGRSAVYQFVGIRLPLLRRRLEHAGDDETLMQRLGLLCESAVRASVQKREFLRRQQPDFFAGQDHGFASVVIVPIGLDALVQEMIGKPLSADDAALAFGEQIIARMLRRVRQEGRSYQLRCVVDGVANSLTDSETSSSPPRDSDLALGPTPALGALGPRQQIRAGAKLHAVAGGGTTLCRLPMDGKIDADQLLDLITFAARETETRRLRLLLPTPARQATFADDWLSE